MSPESSSTTSTLEPINYFQQLYPQDYTTGTNYTQTMNPPDTLTKYVSPHNSSPSSPESMDENHVRLPTASGRDRAMDHSSLLEASGSRVFVPLENDGGNAENSGSTSVRLTPPLGEVDLKLEQKRLEHERQRLEQRKLFEEQMKVLEMQQMKEEQDLLQQASNMKSGSTTATSLANDGHPQSSKSSDVSPRASALKKVVQQPISPSVERSPPNPPRINSASRSLPASRRNSNEADEWLDLEGLTLTERAESRKDNDNGHVAALNPPTSLLQKALTRSMVNDEGGSNGSFSDSPVFPPQFNDKFLFEDDGESSGGMMPQFDEAGNVPPLGSSYVRRYLQMNTEDDDKFPILVRRDSYPGMLSASSAALDLASLSQKSSSRQHRSLDSVRNSEWPQYIAAQKSAAERQQIGRSQLGQLPPVFPSNGKKPPSSLGTQVSFPSKKSDTLPAEGSSMKPAIPKLTPSYSTPELPSSHRLGSGALNNPFNDIMEEALQQQSNAVPDPTTANGVCRFYLQGFCSRGERCQYIHAPIFLTNPLATQGMSRGLMPNITAAAAAQIGFPGGLPINAALYQQQYNISGVNAMGAMNAMINPAVASAGFGFNRNLGLNAAALNANMMRQIQHANLAMSKLANGNAHKRMNNDPEANRFAGVRLEELVGEIYSLCKDQHGCRYLQKKLEEQNEQYLGVIFSEVFSHFVELMTDPFGNYLCQKLLEYCNDEQRTIIVETVAQELVNISLNMHGTRAVQKMIEFLSTPQQIRMVVVALNPNVVTLIKDLNGNHVIQKCLNRLASEDNQFIYNAVSQHCIEVATHRHGCCVLQRCIDHASEQQKMQLVTEITYHALTLVQDPFGNYVVQYVLDLGEPRFSDGLIRRFIGHVCALSVQKFSSNVMEKCIRVAEPDTRKFLIDEMLNKSRLEKLLRDSYANYVVQTSLDYADPLQRVQLVECIKPLLPAIRNTPYGKRIQGKLHRDQLGNGMGMATIAGMGGMGALGGMGLNGMNSMNGMNGLNGMLGFGFNGLNNFGMGMIGLNEFPNYPYM